MLESLRRHVPAFRLWVLCIDDPCYAVLGSLDAPELELIRLRDLESWAPDLVPVKSTRSLIEYYFTLSPLLPLYVQDHDAQADLVTYLDSDLYFFGDVEPLFEELGSGSIAIIEHRFRPALRHLMDFGRYNVGFLSFRRDASGRKCLEWWRDRCLEWCYDRLEGERFADQKYLDLWPELFEGVCVLRHKGANVGPWNVANYSVIRRAEAVRIDEDPLIFYHFHGLKRRLPAVFDPQLGRYLTVPTPSIRRLIYAPYLRALDRAELLIRPYLDYRWAKSSDGLRYAPPAQQDPRGVIRRKASELRALAREIREGSLIYYAKGWIR